MSTDVSSGTATVHQALHGYDQGHRLLAVSTTMPLEAERAMLELSDASGPNPLAGFGECITGYPVPATELYAFAQTWPAPEMRRPGCVWTQTLLIHVADLAHMRQLSRLPGWFRRPTGRSPDTLFYREPLVVPLAADDDLPDRIPASASRISRELLFALYGPTAGRDTPVALLTSRPESYAPIILQMWDQQWPRLRRAFSFCTAAAAPRQLSEQPLTLQVLPPSGIRLWPRGAAAPIIVHDDMTSGKGGGGEQFSALAIEASSAPLGKVTTSAIEVTHTSVLPAGSTESTDPLFASGQTTAAQAEWVESLLADLRGVTDGPGTFGDPQRARASTGGTVQARGLRPLRDFFAHYAVDISRSPRAVLRVLVQLHVLLRRAVVTASTNQIEHADKAEDLQPVVEIIQVILDLLADAFPNPKDAARLKRAVFGGPGQTAVLASTKMEPAMLAVLATSSRAHVALAKGDLRLRARGRRLWQCPGNSSARALLGALRDGVTGFGEEVMTGLAESMPEGAALELGAEFPGILYHVIRARPLVAASPGLWRAAPALRREVVSALEALHRVPADRATLEASGGAALVARRIVGALLDATLDESIWKSTEGADTVGWVARAMGPVAVFAYLDQVDYAHLTSPVAEGWERVLANAVPECRKWLVDHLESASREIHAPALVALALALDPDAARPADRDASEVWARLAYVVSEGRGRERLPLSLRLDALAFALAAAFDEETSARAMTAAQTVVLSFGSVHAAALTDGLTPRAWSRLASRAPAVHWTREWDHAERLREALIRAFERPTWPAALFVSALGDGDALAYTLLRCAQSEDGRRLVRAAREAIRAGEVEASPRQHEAFEAAAKRKPLPELFELFGSLFR